MASKDKKVQNDSIKSVSKKKTGKAVNNNALWIGHLSLGKGGAAVIAIAVIVAIVCTIVQDFGIFSVGSAAGNGSENIIISEIVSDNRSTLMTEKGDAEDWIEITNAGTKDINIGKYLLMLSSDVRKVFSFPNYVLKPGEYIVVFANGVLNTKGSEWSAPFKLSSSGGETLVLMNAQSRTLDSVVLPEIKADMAYVRLDDRSWAESSKATPGYANEVETLEEAAAQEISVEAVGGDIEITEVVTANTIYPVNNGECADYVEIHNKSDRTVNITGWYLSDSSAKLKKWQFPAVSLEAGAYMAVVCDGTNSAEEMKSSLKLSSEGEDIYLTNADGRTVSCVKVPALTKNTAYSYLGGVWTTEIAPTPGMANTHENAAQLNSRLFGNKGVYINEFAASPSNTSCDWLELYNASDSVIDLGGYGLSNDATKPRKWQFPSNTMIQAGEYKIICLPGQDHSKVEGYVNTDFALSADGGYTISLSDPNGNILDAVYVPQQYSGVSYGRMEGQPGWYYLETATGGTHNSGNAYRGHAAQAIYSVYGGTFKTGDSFDVELSAPAGSRIYYTLDSSDPDDRDNLYTGPIHVTGTTIIRTRVYQDGYMPSYMDSQSYLYDVPEGVRIVSLVSDPNGLFSDESGILVKGPNALEKFPYGSMGKGANFWMDWEREAHVEVFTADGDTQLSQECGIKLHGQYSRATPVKAFKVFARSEYGNNRFEAKLFTNRDYESYQSFLIRCSGQDYNKAFMRDSILTSLAKDTSVMYQESDFIVCYINGQYYSIAYLRERISRFSIAQFEEWEGMEDDLDIIKANSNVKQGSNSTFENLLTYVKQSNPASDEFYETLDSAIDIRNYIEYMAIEIFVGNGDTLNVKRYRNKNTDGKWRWVLFDLDWAFDVDTNSITRWLKPGGMGTNLYTDNTLFIACMKNPRFKDEFLTYFGQELATTFSSEHVVGLIKERYDLIHDYLPQYLAKLSLTETDYNKALKKFVNYAETRPSKILGYFNKQFSFSDSDLQKYFGDAIAKIKEYGVEATVE